MSLVEEIKKVYLLIQGPVNTNGISYDGNIHEFNSYNNILKTIESLVDIVSHSVLVTYEDELELTQKTSLMSLGVEIIELPVVSLPNVSVDYDRTLLSGIFKRSAKTTTSKFYQYRTTISGLKYIFNLDSNSITIKMRTDISFDKIGLVNLLNSFNSHKRKIAIQYLRFRCILKIPVIIPAIPDQIFIANTGFLLSLFSGANKNAFSHNVHYDLAISLLNSLGYYQKSIINLEHNYNKSMGIVFIYYYLILLFKRMILSIKFLFIKKKIVLMPREFSKMLEWRGLYPDYNYFNNSIDRGYLF
jgi:hypothetical protein